MAVRYRGEFDETYTESYVLATDIVGRIAPAPTEGSSRLGSGMELVNIEKALRTLNMHVGELRR